MKAILNCYIYKYVSKLMCFVLLFLQHLKKNACKFWLGHDKMAFATANGHFTMGKHLAMTEYINHGQPFIYLKNI